MFYVDEISRLLVTARSIAEVPECDIFHFEREIPHSTLIEMRETLEDALVTINTLIALQRAGVNAHGRQLALKSRGDMNYRLFATRANAAEANRFRARI